MARVTVEDCVERVPNRFELVMLAAQRARNIGAGSPLSVERDRDKNPVVALREIAAETVNLRDLEVNLIQGLQKVVEVDEPGEEEIDLAALQRELTGELSGVVEDEAGETETESEDDVEIEAEEPGSDTLDEEGGVDFDPDGGLERPGGPRDA